MKLPSLVRRTPFRLTLLFLALFAAVSSALLAYIFFATRTEANRRADADIQLELSHVLAAAGQVTEAHLAATRALGLYQRKGNLPGTRESRRYLTESTPA